MILITNPTFVSNELFIINQLLQEGLPLLHVRKPAFSETEMQEFLSKINSEYHKQLVLHQHHHLAPLFKINRLHFTEKNRQLLSPNCNKPATYVSTSVHNIESFNTLPKIFDYAFLSPVYSSISKKNYKPQTNIFEQIKKRTNYTTQLVALGGIAPNNSQYVLSNGFNNIALLGSIWNSNNPLENFKKCQKIALSYLV